MSVRDNELEIEFLRCTCGTDIDSLLPKAYQRLVYRPQGWISAVVLVDGYIQGIWKASVQDSQITLKVNLFSPPGASVQKGLEAEAERLSGFWDTKVVLQLDSQK